MVAVGGETTVGAGSLVVEPISDGAADDVDGLFEQLLEAAGGC